METHSGFSGTSETITAAHDEVAASLLVRTTFMITNDDDDLDIVTLADGILGDEKNFVLKTINAGDSLKIVPANANNFTQITFADSEQGAGCVMLFDGTNWNIVANNGGTIA